MEKFEYVLNPPPKLKVCFGTTLDREVLPQRGALMSSFQKRFSVEQRANLGPGTYSPPRAEACYNIYHKHSSRYGTMSREPRNINFTTEYNQHNSEFILGSDTKPIKANKAPFNSSSSRFLQPCRSSIPGPATYLPKNKKEIIFDHCFGGRKTLKPSVMTLCSPINTDLCRKCEIPCPQQGDYWKNLNTNVCYCRICFKAKYKSGKKLARFQMLMNFKPVRDCSYIHKHEDSKASIKLMTSGQLKRKSRMEVYMDKYFSHILDNKY